MDTLLIQLTNHKAYKLLQDLEDLHLIRVLEKGAQSTKSQSLSEKFAGKLNLTDEQYNNFQKHVKDMRNEWEKDI